MIRKRARLCKWLVRSLVLPWDKGKRLFDGISDWRKCKGRRFSVSQVLTEALVGLVMGKFSLQAIEEAGSKVGCVVRQMFGLVKWASDNTVGRVVARVNWKELRERLWMQVRGFRERKQVEHDALPIGALAIDGKTVAVSRQRMSQFAQASEHKAKTKEGKVKKWTSYKLHMLRCVVTSFRQRLCVWQEPVGPGENEITAAKRTLKELFKKDKGKFLFELVTFDAMLMVYSITKMISEAGRHWLSVLKENQPELLQAAQNWFRPGPGDRPEWKIGPIKDHEFYKEYRIWRTSSLARWVTSHDWNHLKQVWCVEVIRYVRVGRGRGKKAELVVHDRTVRYYATSLPEERFTAAQCLELVRSHWNIEDDVFNALDCVFEEDTRKPFTTGEGTLNMSTLRLMAYNLLQMIRRRKQKNHTWDKRQVWESWKNTIDSVCHALCQFYPWSVVRGEKMLTI